MDKAFQIFGYSALERIAEAPKFNEWMYKTISPFLNGEILEVGSGIGNISDYAIKDGKYITLSDYDPTYVKLLIGKFSNATQVIDIIELDLAKETFQKEFSYLAERFETIFLLNVLEHIENDLEAVANLQFLLKPGGTLVVLVPSYHFLFSAIDQLLGHYRRYTIASLRPVIQMNDLIIKKAFYFNALGMAGWYWNKVFKQTEISQHKMNLFNKLVPIAKRIDKLFCHKIGLSTIIVAQKPEISAL